jgi:hypothetical protein
MFAPKRDFARTDIGRTDIARTEVGRTGCLIMRGVVADAEGKDDQLRHFFSQMPAFYANKAYSR